jgi:hypothetical protein
MHRQYPRYPHKQDSAWLRKKRERDFNLS